MNWRNNNEKIQSTVTLKKKFPILWETENLGFDPHGPNWLCDLQ